MTDLERIEEIFQKRSTYGIKPGLERMHRLLQALNHPEKKLRVVHVAGTNGKGSTVKLISDVLQAASYRVGIFSSPSFTGICGHILINGEEITPTEFLASYERLEASIEQLDRQENHPTPFEILTAISLHYFVDRTDIVMVEAGMGGREDTTNVVEPILSVITTIALDHTEFLGNSMEEIASHKAGIIKENRPVILGNVPSKAGQVIMATAKEKRAPLYLYDDMYKIEVLEAGVYIRTDKRRVKVDKAFEKSYHVHNFALACMALDVLTMEGFSFTDEMIERAMASFQLPGRFEILSEHPTIILDSAHNLAGVEALVQVLKETYPGSRVHVLFAAFKDKAVEEMLDVLEKELDKVTVTSFEHERAMTIQAYEDMDRDQLKMADNWQAYVKKIQKEENGPIHLITGSMHFIMQVRQYLYPYV